MGDTRGSQREAMVEEYDQNTLGIKLSKNK